jgi:transposase
MHIDIVPNRGSSPAILLRESYRDEHGRVKKRTHANLSHALTLEQAYKFRAILQGADIANTSLEDAFEILQSAPHGHVAAVLGSMEQLGVPALLARSDSIQRRCALALVAGRILDPRSKLALSRHLTGSASTLREELGLGADLDEDDLYEAMHWLWERQPKIEERLAKIHLHEGCVVLYDASASYYEGNHCSLAEFGKNSDGKKGKKQIKYGVLATAEGCPVAVEVYPGNTGDPATVADQLRKLRQRFGLKKAIVVGDRGMLTNARLDASAQDPTLADYGWISAMRAPQIQSILKNGDLQIELFDQIALCEIQSEEFPGERIVVCRNPALAVERKRKRDELLAETEKVLLEIQAACRRPKNPYRGKDKIARRIERQAAKYKVLKHFDLQIGEDDFTFARQSAKIEAESTLDGFYAIRARNVSAVEMDTAKLVETYKSLSGVERIFRSLKTISLKVRPIFHREEDMVRAHVFVCMVAGYVQWHMERKLAPLLFADEQLEEQKALRENPVVVTQRSASAQAKEVTKRTAEGLPVHSFQTLLKDLAGLSRSQCLPKIQGAKTFTKLGQLSALQAEAFRLLGVRL